MASLFQLPKITGLPGAKLFFFRTNTATPQDVFTDEDCTVAHTQPVEADGAGVFPPIYLAQTDYNYRVSYYTSADVLIYTVDDIPNNLGNGREIIIESANAFVKLIDTGGGANEKVVKLTQSGGDLTLSILNDAESVEQTVAKLFRTGTNPDRWLFIADEHQAQVGADVYDVGLVSEGSFTGTLTGMSGATTGTIYYKVVSGIVTLWVTTDVTGTSNTTALTMTGLPTAVRPGSYRSVHCDLHDNTQAGMAALAIVEPLGTITFRLARQDSIANLIQYSATGFTNSGTKGLGSTWTISYIKTS